MEILVSEIYNNVYQRLTVFGILHHKTQYIFKYIVSIGKNTVSKYLDIATDEDDLGPMPKFRAYTVNW